MANGKVLNLETFTATLESYKNTLEDMHRLTENELKRVTSLEIKVVEDSELLEKEATRFLNQQMYVYLGKLSNLVNEIPSFMLPKDAFLTKDLQEMQKQVLQRLKDQGHSEYFYE
ncbi:hypothetical protein [Adhaeribacter soli]|uniref:Uncharacterized protein n=1 Tax=Adhaeribacter soli TaxID=2607655 RepID=A0A5N1J4B8_9BACT|nr:hypothetical protein [Adhaeribacter soli]KAA9345751.1 hypothetical protein F0P94_01305 [Adhaeribacter soli]